MSSFTQFNAPLNVVPDKEASKILGDDYYMVQDGFTYYIGHEGSNFYVRVDHGFLSDGASVPRPFRWLLPRWGKYGQAAVLHDKLCETFQKIELKEGREYLRDIPRIEVDAIFYEAMDVLKVNKIVSGVIRFFVDAYRWVKDPQKPNVSPVKQALERQNAEQKF